MKHATLFLCGVLVSLLICLSAEGQGCVLSMTPHYSIYQSVARDSATIYTSVSAQGYASINPSAGCNLNGVTHQPKAYNLISSTGGWLYGAPQCATCYLSIVNSQEIVGVPGVLYPFHFEGDIMCSLAGLFYSGGGSANLLGCVVPSTETTADIGFNGAAFREQFDMTLSDSAGDNLDGQYLQEATAQPGTNSCFWPNSGLAQSPGAQGSSWTIGNVGGTPEHNHWGYDSIGWNLADLDNITRNGPAHGVKFPCVTTIYQAMKIMCNANTWWTYRTNIIAITVDISPNSEEACRDGECGIPIAFQ